MKRKKYPNFLTLNIFHDIFKDFVNQRITPPNASNPRLKEPHSSSSELIILFIKG